MSYGQNDDDVAKPAVQLIKLIEGESGGAIKSLLLPAIGTNGTIFATARHPRRLRK